MKIRYLGHSCVEITGRHHILIDPDFTRDPEPNVEYICITHAHKDHIGRVADIPNAIILASADVCEIAASLGVSRERLHPVVPGEQVANVQILAGYSMLTNRFTHFSTCYFDGGAPIPAVRLFPSWCRMKLTCCISAMRTKHRFPSTRIFCACPGAQHPLAPSAIKIL